MTNLFDGLPFAPADILLPQDCEYAKWSVVACDQYTSQPEYWQRVEEYVGSAPSALRLILPESCLDGPNVETDIMEINNTMTRYLREDRFRTLPASLIYVERRLDNLRLRRGLVGMVDLEQYDYEPGSSALVRATEGTVMSRIPPRVAVRKNAPLELPHVMLLADDPEKTVIEPLSARKDRMEQVYDFDLMERGGHIAGWKLDGESMALVASALRALADPAAFNAKYGTVDKPVMLFAVGDGNHSLATAKECYERQKKLTPPEHWDALPARYALCELVNLHDASLEFEPIHRVVFGVEPEGTAMSCAGTPRTGRAPSPCPIPTPSWRWAPSSPCWTSTSRNTAAASTTSTARTWPGNWPPAPATSPSSCPPWARSSSSPPSSTTASSPARPSPWGRPTTSGSIWRPGKSGNQEKGSIRGARRPGAPSSYHCIRRRLPCPRWMCWPTPN